MNERERLASELERIEHLRDRERVREDYGIEPIISELFR
jgi:hypothetical protein